MKSKKINYILGFQSYANHDSGASILKFDNNNKVLDYVAISEERLLRKKYPYTFPLLSIKYCLDHFNLKSLSNISFIVSDWIRLKRWFRSGPGYNYGEFDYIKEKLNFDKKKIIQINHHLAHAASTYYPSGFKKSSILIVDGNGSDLETNSYFLGENYKIKFLKKAKYYGLGALYTSISNEILNFGTGGEGKTMGLAPYGTKKFVKKLSCQLNGVNTTFSKILKRMPFSDILNFINKKYRSKNLKLKVKKANSKNVFSKYYASWAYSVQDMTEKVMCHLGKDIKKLTKSNNICIAGGVALNCIANQKLFKKNKFKNMFVFPACSDSGIPFGLTLWAYYNFFKGKKKLNFENAYTGSEYNSNKTEKFLKRNNIKYEKINERKIAELISLGKIIGHFDGKSEYGPRALGNRSILADSRSNTVRDHINKKVKHRELFRPFAPIILEEKCNEYFDLNYSPFMLRAAKAKNPHLIPSVIHVDKTSRVQTINKKQNEKIYNIIREFDKITGIPCILNTSFNDKGEPLVETPADALICFMQTDIDYLILHNFLIDKKKFNYKKILNKLKIKRERKITSELKNTKNLFTKNYHNSELKNKIKKENLKATKYVLDRPFSIYKNFFESKKNSKSKDKYLIIGSNDHTRILMSFFKNYIDEHFSYFELKDNDISKNKKKINTIKKINSLKNINQYDKIIISTFEYSINYEEMDNKKIINPYDNSSRSLIDYYLINKYNSVKNAEKI